MNNYPPSNNNYNHQGSNPFGNPNPQYDPYYRISLFIQHLLKKNPITPEVLSGIKTKDSTKDSSMIKAMVIKTIFMEIQELVSSEKFTLFSHCNYLLLQVSGTGGTIVYGSNKPLEILQLSLCFQFSCLYLLASLVAVCKPSEHVLFQSSLFSH